MRGGACDVAGGDLTGYLCGLMGLVGFGRFISFCDFEQAWKYPEAMVRSIGVMVALLNQIPLRCIFDLKLWAFNWMSGETMQKWRTIPITPSITASSRLL